MTNDAEHHGLERHPHGGQEPGDTDVQAERQEEDAIIDLYKAALGMA